jgi:flagellar basal body-associated protein FliL
VGHGITAIIIIIIIIIIIVIIIVVTIIVVIIIGKEQSKEVLAEQSGMSALVVSKLVREVSRH